MSINDIDPSTLFGGTWEPLKDRFLLGAGSTYTAGNTGGEATHKLTIDEMPSHDHNMGGYFGTYGSTGSHKVLTQFGSHENTEKTGGDKAYNNMPPYLVVYMWKRTA